MLVFFSSSQRAENKQTRLRSNWVGGMQRVEQDSEVKRTLPSGGGWNELWWPPIRPLGPFTQEHVIVINYDEVIVGKRRQSAASPQQESVGWPDAWVTAVTVKSPSSQGEGGWFKPGWVTSQRVNDSAMSTNMDKQRFPVSRFIRLQVRVKCQKCFCFWEQDSKRSS